MTSEQRLDRLERIARLFVRTGLRERRNRRQLDEKFNIIVNAQIDNEERFARLSTEITRVQNKLAASIAKSNAELARSIDRTRDELAQSMDRTHNELAGSIAQSHNALAKAQTQTENRLNSLIETIHRDRNGSSG